MSSSASAQWLALLLTFSLAGAVAKADETIEKDTERSATVAQLTKALQSYSISMGDEQPEPLELVKSPVLHYSDQISPVTDGLAFVWKKDARDVNRFSLACASG